MCEVHCSNEGASTIVRIDSILCPNELRWTVRIITHTWIWQMGWVINEKYLFWSEWGTWFTRTRLDLHVRVDRGLEWLDVDRSWINASDAVSSRLRTLITHQNDLIEWVWNCLFKKSWLKAKHSSVPNTEMWGESVQNGDLSVWERELASLKDLEARVRVGTLKEKERNHQAKIKHFLYPLDLFHERF
jgi:hypothetical protein